MRHRFNGCGGIGGRVFSVAGDVGYLGRPACEGIGILGVGSFGGGFGIEGGGGAIRHILVRFQNGSVLILPGDGIGVYGRAVSRGINGVAGDCGGNGIPPRKGIGILRVGGFDRIAAVKLGDGADGNILVCFQNGAVFILPGDGVSRGFRFVRVHGIVGNDEIIQIDDGRRRNDGGQIPVLVEGRIDVISVDWAVGRAFGQGNRTGLRFLPSRYFGFHNYRKQIDHILGIKSPFHFQRILQVRILCDFTQEESGEIRNLHIFYRPVHADDPPAPKLRALGKPIQGACLIRLTEPDDPVSGAVKDFPGFGVHTAGGAADAGDHSAGTDLQALVPGQRRGHIEHDLPGLQLDLELPSGFLDGDGGVHGQLDGLGIIQADIGAAVVTGLDAVAAVKLDALKVIECDASGVLDGDAALHQLHAHGNGFWRGGQGGRGEPQHQEKCKNNRKQSFHIWTSKCKIELYMRLISRG